MYIFNLRAIIDEPCNGGLFVLKQTKYCGEWDLNPRPSAYEADELPNCSIPL